MGRMLDTLKNNDPHRHALPAPARPAPQIAPECVVDWSVADEQVPFVEVGGPNKQVEVSPLLVKHPPQPKVQPPHQAPAPTPVINLTQAKPMTVAFEPWPGHSTAAIAPEIVAYHQPDHPVAREYAALFEALGTATGVTLLTGIKPHVGTSTVLFNLAVIAAKTRRVIVVDAHRTRPSLASRLGIDATAGLAEVMAGSVALEQAIVSTAIPSLHLLPAAGKAHTPLTTEALTWLLACLRERFELVLIDGSCVEEPGGLGMLVPLCDALYLVLPQGETDMVNKGTAQTLARLGGRLRGLIHTHFEM